LGGRGASLTKVLSRIFDTFENASRGSHEGQPDNLLAEMPATGDLTPGDLGRIIIDERMKEPVFKAKTG
jgi:hypothetical protein